MRIVAILSWTTLMIGSLMATTAPRAHAVENDYPLPEKLKPPQGQVMLFKAKAIGVQIYVCKAKVDDPDRSEWVLKGPDAELFDEGGRRLGRHYAGPTWASKEGESKVVGELISQTPAPKSGNIPWLLLKSKSAAGEGLFGKVTYIQRVDTEGGVAPTEGTGRANQGREIRVKYKATYVFFGPSGGWAAAGIPCP